MCYYMEEAVETIWKSFDVEPQVEKWRGSGGRTDFRFCVCARLCSLVLLGESGPDVLKHVDGRELVLVLGVVLDGDDGFLMRRQNG